LQHEYETPVVDEQGPKTELTVAGRVDHRPGTGSELQVIAGECLVAGVQRGGVGAQSRELQCRLVGETGGGYEGAVRIGQQDLATVGELRQ
jgi:hypothetical protein